MIWNLPMIVFRPQASILLVTSTYTQAFDVTQNFLLSIRDSVNWGQTYWDQSRVFRSHSTKMFCRGTNIVASAAQGAVFGIMAMRLYVVFLFILISYLLFPSMQHVDIKATAAGGDNNTPKGTLVGAIVGGVIGELVLILVLTGAIFFWRSRMQQATNIPGPNNRTYSVLRPFHAQAIPVSLNDH
jgi:hypothetical protein